MLSGEQVEETSNTDSCQATATSQEAIQTVTTYTTGTVATTPVRRRTKTIHLRNCRFRGIVHYYTHHYPDHKESISTLKQSHGYPSRIKRAI